MSKPRETEVYEGVELSEMDIVRGIVGWAVACGLTEREIEQAVYAEGVETLEDWDAAISATIKLKEAIGGEG